MRDSKTITLGILPFENLTGKSEFDLVSRSFGYALITELSRFKQFTIRILNVASQDDDAVDYDISGSFSAGNERLHLHARLLKTKTGDLLWANQFEGNESELLDLQNSLIHEITASLQQQVNYDLISQIRQKPMVKLKAYEYWLHGMEELKRGSLESDEKAREYFTQAIEKDPDYSLAYSGMSLTYFNEWSCQLWERWDVSQNGAFDWAEKAIELDEENYIAALVLGRVFLYEGAYESSEFYLRKSLSLNSNDPDSLVQIASCLVFLGQASEAWELYEKAVELNPSRKAAWNTVATFILFELGEMEKAAEYIIRQGKSRWVDAYGYYAATYYHLGHKEKMHQYWKKYLDEYGQIIAHGKPFTELEAIEWMMKVNPFKFESKLIPFWKDICDSEVLLNRDQQPGTPASSNIFIKEADLWQLGYESKQVLLGEVKGFYDIQKLLQNPGESFHCAELMGSVLESEGTTLIDEDAKRAYQKRLLDLQESIELHETQNDYAQASKSREEYDQLIDHLSGSLGLGGRSRQSGRTVEKARSAVTWRIRSAISKIESAHPAMGKHLSNAIKTGTLCTYMPEKKITWQVS